MPVAFPRAWIHRPLPRFGRSPHAAAHAHIRAVIHCQQSHSIGYCLSRVSVRRLSRAYSRSHTMSTNALDRVLSFPRFSITCASVHSHIHASSNVNKLINKDGTSRAQSIHDERRLLHQNTSNYICCIPYWLHSVLTSISAWASIWNGLWCPSKWNGNDHNAILS